jgi:glutamine amidotransferase
MIVIVDYGMGNLRSVQKAFEAVGAQASISSDPAAVAKAERVVLPGVGAFADAIAELRQTGLDRAFIEAVHAGKPCLGVCLGMQLLFEVSEEDGLHQGLGLLPGRVVRFTSRPGLKIPHMGWNTLTFNPVNPCPLFIDQPEHPSVYFVHSYFVQPARPEDVAATADHPEPFTAAVARGNLFGCQFHPEKSQTVGLKIYRAFTQLPLQVS